MAQFRVKKLTNGLHDLHEDLLEKCQILKERCFIDESKRVIHSKYFEALVKSIVLKDVSLMSSLVSAVREANIEKRLQTEQKMIYLTFACDHQNYARYSIYQSCHLDWLKQKKRDVSKNLTEK